MLRFAIAILGVIPASHSYSTEFAVVDVGAKADGLSKDTLVGQLPTHGIYPRHRKGLRLKIIQIKTIETDPRPQSYSMTWKVHSKMFTPTAFVAVNDRKRMTDSR